MASTVSRDLVRIDRPARQALKSTSWDDWAKQRRADRQRVAKDCQAPSGMSGVSERLGLLCNFIRELDVEVVIRFEEFREFTPVRPETEQARDEDENVNPVNNLLAARKARANEIERKYDDRSGSCADEYACHADPIEE